MAVILVIIIGAIGLGMEPAAKPTVTPPSTQTPTPTPTPAPAWTPSAEQKSAAVNYLVGHFNDSIGLIYESEDTGTRITVNGIPYRCNQSYFIYSDNLLAKYALNPTEPQISQRINQTIQSYGLPPSDFFEVLFGQTISEPICNGKTVDITNDANSVVLAEFRNYSDPIGGTYANALIYKSLNCYLKGNFAEAKQYFNQTLALWDGKGIYDNATAADGKYANYKLALLVYDSKVLNMPVDSAIEQKLWSMQQANGGITSLADLNGNPVGTANTETTAMTLLTYNNQLISEMQVKVS